MWLCVLLSLGAMNPPGKASAADSAEVTHSLTPADAFP